MKIDVLYPSPQLADIVKCYWVLEKGAGQHTERLYPCGETQIIFHYGNPFTEITGKKITRQPQSIVCGQMTTFKDILASESAGLFGIIFQPYSLNTVLHVASHELLQYSYGLTDINKTFQPLENKIRGAADTRHRISIIEHFLVERITIPNEFHFRIMKESVNMLTAPSTEISVKKIAEKYSLSERQFERIYKDYVGLPPKSFAEIMRFKRAFFLLQKDADLTHVSYSSGYYDQSHFIRAFKKFSGHTPGEYLRIAG